MSEILITVGLVLIFAAYQSGRENSWWPMAGWSAFLAVIIGLASLP
jgi:hypothetical protein